MSTSARTQRIAEVSPGLRARIAGSLSLLDGLAAPFAEFFVRGKLVVYASGTATATNILAHERLYRLGAAAWLIALTCDAAVAVIFYGLFKPVSRSLALLMAFFRLMFVAVMAANCLNYFAPLVFLRADNSVTAFNPDQLQALTIMSHRLFNTGYDISMVFWGVHIILLGWLVLRSTFLPRVFAVLLGIGGLCYLINSFADFLAPAFGNAMGLYIVMPGAVAELLLLVWLLVMGVNDQRWKEQASAAGASTLFG